MKLSQRGIDFIKEWEKCRLTAYLDGDTKKKNRVWTIGWGETGPGIKMGTTWSQAKADASFAARSDKIAMQVDTLIQTVVSQNQFDAIVSLAYNIGIEAFRNSTLLRLLNAGKPNEAADQFLRWNHDDGEVVEGLTKRRFAECTLFKTPDSQSCTPTPVSQPTRSLADWLKSMFSGFFTSR